MQNYNVVKTKETNNHVIIHEVITGNGKRETYEYSAIIGGLSWPVAKSPAYYCIWGEIYLEDIKHDANNKQRGKLTLFAEQEFSGLSLNDFFVKLTDDTTLYLCNCMYTNMSEDYLDYADRYRSYASKERIRTGSLKSAPYVDNFRLGLSLIQDWIKDGLLDVPENSIVYGQLKNVTLADLEESPEIKFYAINGLRFAVGAFEKYPVSHYVYPIHRNSYSGPASWMR